MIPPLTKQMKMRLSIDSNDYNVNDKRDKIENSFKSAEPVKRVI